MSGQAHMTLHMTEGFSREAPRDSQRKAKESKGHALRLNALSSSRRQW